MAETVEGLAALQKALKRLSLAQQGRSLASATNFAMTAVKKEAEKRAPKGTEFHKTHKGGLVGPGFASRSVRKKTKQGKKKNRAFTFVGVLPEAFYALQFVELGTGPRYDKSGRYLGQIKPQPWLEPAYEAVKNEVESRLATKLKERITKFTK